MLSIPDGPLWIICGWFITAYVSYKYGRISEKRNRKDAAQVLLIGQIMAFIHRAETSEDMAILRNEALSQIESAVFEFAARAKDSDAEKIQDAFRKFRDIPHKELVVISVVDFKQVIYPKKLNYARSLFCNALNELKENTKSA